MNLQNSYFSIKNPLEIASRWLNPFSNQTTIAYQNKDITVRWTQRAETAFSTLEQPLFVEMQIYFSCVVKKRVLFHQQLTEDLQGMEFTTVNDNISILCRTVQSATCSAEEFAHSYPIKQVLTSPSARKMLPGELYIDCKNQQWFGEFTI
ncbi:MAG: hypothetical protein PVG75_11335 [Thioalkalispiraceae bacterium]|jgi:hypothetical protein